MCTCDRLRFLQVCACWQRAAWAAIPAIPAIPGPAAAANAPGSDPPCPAAARPVAVGETVILLHPALPSVSVSAGMKRGVQQNDSLADGCRPASELRPESLSPRAVPWREAVSSVREGKLPVPETGTRNGRMTPKPVAALAAETRSLQRFTRWTRMVS